MPRYTIPILFTVDAVSERQGARTMGDILVMLRIPETFAVVEDWWMPNHPEVDGNDVGTPPVVFATPLNTKD